MAGSQEETFRLPDMADKVAGIDVMLESALQHSDGSGTRVLFYNGNCLRLASACSFAWSEAMGALTLMALGMVFVMVAMMAADIADCTSDPQATNRQSAH